uniref:Putative ovule protein n=1 Tax=Solanum chacoense TaxID=4108 RepID=A0A0V0IJB7_SOLCH
MMNCQLVPLIKDELPLDSFNIMIVKPKLLLWSSKPETMSLSTNKTSTNTSLIRERRELTQYFQIDVRDRDVLDAIDGGIRWTELENRHLSISSLLFQS